MAKLKKTKVYKVSCSQYKEVDHNDDNNGGDGDDFHNLWWARLNAIFRTTAYFWNLNLKGQPKYYKINIITKLTPKQNKHITTLTKYYK